MKQAYIAVSAALVLSLIFGAVLFGRVRQAERRIDELTEQLVEVESGAAFALAQLGVFESALGNLGPGTSGSLDEAITGLEAFATSTITMDITFDESVPIQTEFLLQRELIVPIKTDFPINQTIDTTITIDGPLGSVIPLDISVPVDIVIPVDLEVPIAVDETIPIDVEVPISLRVPVQIDVAGTELAVFAESLRQGLVALRGALTQLGG